MHAEVDMKLDVGGSYLTPENTSSGVGMSKAGLALVGQLSFRIECGVGLDLQVDPNTLRPARTCSGPAH
jgi:hypothetical protein